MAMAKPPSVIVLSVTPKRFRRMTDDSSDSGMTMMQIKAVRKFHRNLNPAGRDHTTGARNALDRSVGDG
jgi:hypothetical protein